MTTPQYPDPNQPPDPNAYQPPDPSAYQPPDPSAYQPPDPRAYQPPSGAHQQPNVDPPPGQPGAYPPPGQPGAYPPPGQPGGMYPPPGAPGMPPAPGEQPKKSTTPRIILAVAVVVIVVLGIVLYVVNRKSDPDYAKVGDCIQYSSETDVKVVDCTSDGAQYKVQKRIDGTSDQDACANVEDSDVSLYTKDGGKKQYTLCVSLVLAQGDCLSTDFDKVACSDPSAGYKVEKIIEGSTDENACPEGTQGRAYQADDRVVCIAQAS